MAEDNGWISWLCSHKLYLRMLFQAEVIGGMMLCYAICNQYKYEMHVCSFVWADFFEMAKCS